MSFKKLVFLFAFSVALSVTGIAQEKINWLTWEEALAKQKVEKKKIVVDIYTDWCTWCKKMDKTTFQTPHIAEYINDNYIAVKFDAEQKQDIIFNNKIYKLITGFGKHKYHELAFEIMNGKISYPTVVFIDEDLDVIQPIAGFTNARTMEQILHFFAGNHYTAVPWKEYIQTFISPNYPVMKQSGPASAQPPVTTVKNRN